MSTPSPLPPPIVPTLSPEKERRVQEILDRFGVPREQQGEYRVALVSLIEAAFDAYFAQRRHQDSHEME